MATSIILSLLQHNIAKECSEVSIYDKTQSRKCTHYRAVVYRTNKHTPDGARSRRTGNSEGGCANETNCLHDYVGMVSTSKSKRVAIA